MEPHNATQSFVAEHPRLVYGCMRLVGDGSAGDRERGKRAVRAAVDAGFTHFDHADIYAGGACEALFGEALREAPGLRDSLTIIGKCGIRFEGDPGPSDPKRYDFSASHIEASVNGSLERLGIERLDALLLHLAGRVQALKRRGNFVGLHQVVRPVQQQCVEAFDPQALKRAVYRSFDVARRKVVALGIGRARIAFKANAAFADDRERIAQARRFPQRLAKQCLAGAAGVNVGVVEVGEACVNGGPYGPLAALAVAGGAVADQAHAAVYKARVFGDEGLSCVVLFHGVLPGESERHDTAFTYRISPERISRYTLPRALTVREDQGEDVQSVITIKQLDKTYAGGFQALKAVNLDIQRGEIFALLGPNGAGKTTLISIICGIVNPGTGSVTVDGFDIIRDYREARQRIGLVPQELNTDAFESVWDTVTFSRRLFGKAPDPAYIEKLLRDLALWDKRDARIMMLSGGMKRRVMIAKALSHEPEILFLDEPTAGVDVELRRGMWEMVRELREKGVTIILTTHYIEEAEEMADRIGVINNGELVLVEEKAALMKKLGRKQLMIHLQCPLEAVPEALSGYPVTLSDDGLELVYTFDAQQERTGIAGLVRALSDHDIHFKDLQTRQDSLQEIFVSLVGARS